jgi:hypothetical protein
MFKMAPLVGTFRYYLTQNILTLCEHISSHHLRFYQTSAQSEFKYGRQAAILENQLRDIDLKLCTYVPLGKSNSQTKFWSSLILGLATRPPWGQTLPEITRLCTYADRA